MVADSIIYHPTFSKLIKFLESNSKREKCFRLVTYLSRFLSYYLQRLGYPVALVQKFKDLKQHATMIRKGMRFLKPLGHLQAASKIYDNKLMDPVLLTSLIVRELGFAGYLTLDTITWMKMMGLLNKSKFASVSTWASRFWLAALIAGVVNSVRTYNISSAKLGAADEKTDAAALREKMYAAKRKVVWTLLDMFICLNLLDYLHFSEGDIGFAGVITSVMGLKDMWAAT